MKRTFEQGKESMETRSGDTAPPKQFGEGVKRGTGEPDDDMLIYHRLMEELKIRLSAMRGMLEELSTLSQSPHAFIVAESCYLQVRYICEIIALATLAIHRTPETTKKLLGEFHPKATLEALSRQNKDAFPRAITLHDADGQFHFEFAPENDMYAKDLYDIYNACGGALHRGNLKTILSGERKFYDLALLDSWMMRLAKFLDQHTILLDGHNNVFVVNLSGGESDATLVQRGTLKNNPV